MFDRITLGSQRAAIRPEVIHQATISKGPSKAYSRWKSIEVNGLQVMFSSARRDLENNSPKHNLLLSFNGFDAGGYERTSAILQSIIFNEDIGNLAIDKLECCLDIRAAAPTLQPHLDFDSVRNTQYFGTEKRKPWLYHEKISSGGHTLAFGNPNHYQLKAYDKTLERSIRRPPLSPDEQKILGQITRLEITYGRHNKRIQRLVWKNLYQWLDNTKPFSEIGWYALPPVLPLETSIYSVDGIFLHGLHSLIRGGIALKSINQKLKKRQPWEQKYFSELYQSSLQSIERPPFEQMFAVSARRFFASRDGPLPAMIWRLNGSGCDLLPHGLMRGKTKQNNGGKTHE